MGELGEWAKQYNKNMRDWMEEITRERAFGDVPIISDVGYTVAALFAGLTTLLVQGIENLVSGIVNVLLDGFNVILFKPIENHLNKILNFFISRQLLDKKVKDLYTQLQNDAGTLGGLLGIIFNLSTILNVFGAIIEVSNVKTQQTMLEQILPMIPSQEQLLRLLFIYPNKEKTVYDLLHKYGYNDSMIRLMYDSAKAVLSDQQIQLLFWRKIFNERRAIHELNRTGYTSEDAQNVIDSWEVIPSIQDLLWMVGKEAFEPRQIERYGLEDEFPHEQRIWLEKQGLSEYWQRKYWVSHWSYPSPQQVLELLHRGKLDPEDVFEYYKVVEMPPYWRKKLMEASYKVYTRVDLRRMEELNIVKGMEALVKGYKEQGYDEEHATNMAKFTIKYNQRRKSDLTRNRIIEFYVKGIITEQDVILYLEELDYDRTEIMYYIRDAKLKIKKEYIDTLLDSTEDLYVNNRINTGEVFSRLNSVNMSAEKIEVYIDKWNVIKSKTRRYPSKEDLIKFFSSGIIDENTFIQVMGFIGFSRKYIGWYLKSITKEK